MKQVLKLVFKAKYSKNPEPSSLNLFQILEKLVLILVYTEKYSEM